MRTLPIMLSGMVAAAALACGGDPRDRFVGTWKLVRVERYDAAGEMQPPPAPGDFGAGAPLGYLMYGSPQTGVGRFWA